MVRVATHVIVGAQLRRASAAGAFATVLRRGERQAGALFVLVRHDGGLDLHAPVPGDESGVRRVEAVLSCVDEGEIAERLTSEARFDPDHWVVEIEDAAGRTFLDG